jgi:toxin ParE1/3/4
VADYVLSNKADNDLDEIYVYSYRAFGEAKADAYFQSLSGSLETLARNPRLGRPAHIRPGLFCYSHGRHVIFYMIEATGIFVVRVLHDAMDFAQHIEE